jgi:hypothetical protein
MSNRSDSSAATSSLGTRAVRTCDAQSSEPFRTLKTEASATRQISSSATITVSAGPTVTVRATHGPTIRITYDVVRETRRRENLRANGLLLDTIPSTDDSR